MSGYDLIVVGAGASGSVIAARASEDPDRSVLLVEAGPTPRAAADFPAALLDGAQVPGARPTREHHWSYQVNLTEDRPYSVFRGRVLGGSTSTNGGYFVRARHEDFADWARIAGPSWSYNRVLPYLRGLESDRDYGDTAVHGATGPVPVQRADLDSAASAAFVQAASELGHPFEADKNDQGNPGVGPVPLNVADGVRWNAGLAYVVPALVRPNLTVVGECTVRRIRFARSQAVALDVQMGDRSQTIEAGEIVVCAGAFETPHLLLRSGVGPADELRALGLPVVADRPGVGRRFSDHPQLVIDYSVPGPLPGPASGSWIGASLNFRSSTGPASGDLQILQSNVPMSVLTGHRSDPDGAPLPLLISALTPVSTGRLRLASDDPGAPLIVDYRYLSTPGEVARLREATRAALDLLHSRAFAAVSCGPHDPDLTAAARDDASLDRWIRARLGTALHASGTAPIGPITNPTSVVDEFGKAHDLPGLRIADTSILPAAPLRGPAATAVLIGEVIAAALSDIK